MTAAYGQCDFCGEHKYGRHDYLNFRLCSDCYAEEKYLESLAENNQEENNQQVCEAESNFPDNGPYGVSQWVAIVNDEKLEEEMQAEEDKYCTEEYMRKISS